MSGPRRVFVCLRLTAQHVRYVWLKGTAYDSNVGHRKKRNMNMNIQVPVFDLHIGKGQRLLDNAELNIQLR